MGNSHQSGFIRFEIETKQPKLRSLLGGNRPEEP